MIKTLPFLGSMALALAALCPAAALACSPIKVHYVHFDPDSATVSADEVSSLSAWMKELRKRYPNHEAIDVESWVEPREGDHAPQGLGLERARNVARVLREDLHFNATISLSASSYVAGPGSSSNSSLGSGRVIGAQLDFLPACPHECPCQLGDPLYQPPTTR